MWLGRDANVTVGFEGLETMENGVQIGGIVSVWVAMCNCSMKKYGKRRCVATMG